MKRTPDELYARPEYTPDDVLRAAEVLLLAGFTEEGIAVLAEVFGTREEMRKALEWPR